MLAFWSPSAATHFAFCFTVVLRLASGPRVKVAGRKSALNPWWFIDRSKALVPVLILLNDLVRADQTGYPKKLYNFIKSR